MQTPAIVQVLYFAAAREKIGLAQEAVALPAEVTTLGALRALLAERHPILALAAIRSAVNQSFAGPETPIAPGDEIAFSPTHHRRLR